MADLRKDGPVGGAASGLRHHESVVDLFAGPGGWDVGARRVGLDPLGIEWDDAACATRKAAGLSTVQADVAELDPLDFAPRWGLIASPPCQAWSMAGKGGGRRDKEHVIACALEVAAGNDSRAEHAAKCEDARSILVVEPLRWTLALRPEWIAFEQVPPVLELWTLFAEVLRQHGYSVWAGVLEAERYGVPQTRERAVLIGSRVAAVHPPRATHQRYVPGEPQRHDVTLEGEVLPWVSMAEALGWGMTGRPTHTVTGGGTGGGGGVEVFASGDVRRVVERERERGAWVMRQASWLQGEDWPEQRPATTVAGDSRIFQPGGHHEQGQQSQNAVRVTVQEAATLQTFPPDYPWQGSRSKQFEMVGNAVPPLLAEAILRALVGDHAIDERRAA